MSEANMIVVFTCGGFNFTESRSVKTIQKALSLKKKNCIVVVTGCLVKINPDAFAHLAEADVIPAGELHKLDKLINATMPYDEFPDVNCVSDIVSLNNISKIRKFAERFNFNVNFIKTLAGIFQEKLEKRREKEIFYIKISQGCLGNCTYCAIKISRGKLQSKPPDIIIDEFRKGLDSGYKHFMFVTQDMGCYGLDVGTDIFTLLKSVFEDKRSFQCILHDFNVQWLIKEQKLLDLLITHKNKIGEITIPIQSGSDRILKLMKRPYTREETYNVLTQIRARMPDVKVGTQLMVGFPGETHKDFMETSRLIDDYDFYSVNVFRYQDRPGVEAAFLPNKVSSKLKVKRAHELAAKGRHIRIIG
jgi:threonylcarbamoyladenosine tRNA methylthiotransferase MtaB